MVIVVEIILCCSKR